MKKLAARLVDALIGVGAEEVTLGLQQVGRQAFRAVSVKKRERSGKRRGGDAETNCVNDGFAPGGLIVVQRLTEEIVQQQVGQFGVLIIGFFDFAQKTAPDDAAAAPHQ